MFPAVAAPFLPSLKEFTTQKEAEKAEMSIKKMLLILGIILIKSYNPAMLNYV